MIIMYTAKRKYKRSEFGWLDDIHKLPNHFNTNDSNKMDMSKATFDLYDNFGEGEYIDTYSYQQRLMGELMKRWHNNMVCFYMVGVPGYGYVKIDPIDRFSLHETGYENSYTRHESPIMAFGEGDMSDELVQIGTATLNFHSLQLVVQLDDNDLDFRDAVFTVDIDRITPTEVWRQCGSDKLVICNNIVLAKDNLDLVVNEQTKDKTDVSDEDLDQLKIMLRGPVDYIDLDRVRMGAVNETNAQHEGEITINDNILPWYPENFSIMSKLTGISTTTLSELRHGKTDVNRILDSTASILTHYANIRFLDAMIAYVRFDANVDKLITLNDGSLFESTYLDDDSTDNVDVHAKLGLFNRFMRTFGNKVDELTDSNVDTKPIFSFQVTLNSGVQLDFDYVDLDLGKRDLRELRNCLVGYHNTKLSNKDFITRCVNDSTDENPHIMNINDDLLYVGNIDAIRVTKDITREPFKG